MRKIFKGLAFSAALVGATALPAQAQTGWGALGIHGGWMSPARMDAGTEGQFRFGDAAALGGSLDFWWGQLGFGVEGTYSNWSDFAGNIAVPTNPRVEIAKYDASLLLRFAPPAIETRFMPYVSAGIGGVSTNAREALVVPGADVEIVSGWRTVPAAALAIGTDFFMTPNVALRLQLKDYWTNRSPYRRLDFDAGNGAVVGTLDRQRGGHNWLLNGGVSFYFGPQRVVEPGFVVEEPIVAPPPPPPAAPAPPAEEMVMICIIDQQDFQIRAIEAIHVPAEQRVLVMRDGQRVPFEQAYPTTAPAYARGATWYMADRPLVIDLDTRPMGQVRAEDRQRLEFVLFGSPAQRMPEDLVLLGTIEGTPVYGAHQDIAGFRGRLEQHHATTRDLGVILRQDEQLSRDMAAIGTLYVAVEPGCVFQPISVTHFVRRVRG